MFRVALIQNQSEMAHYGYADARPLLKEYGYDVTLFTADNIKMLNPELARNQYDAVVFGSNAFNDKRIRVETWSEEFQSSFQAWLEKGHGCLCLHQLRLATFEDSTLPFLPAKLNQVSAVVRPTREKSADGIIDYGSKSSEHILLLYPNKVVPTVVQANANNYRSLPGLYWHSWTNISLAEWEELLVDTQSEEGPRSLLISSREPRNYRVVLSSLTLDWQKQQQLLQNIMCYVVEGRHNTAVLIDEGNSNAAFDYLIGTLKASRYPFKQYFLGQDCTVLLNHIINKVHTILVTGPFVLFDHLPEELRNIIIEKVIIGQLKLIAIDVQGKIKRFSVAGRERIALRLLHNTELRIQSELLAGYIDGSFWSTAETLQTLDVLPESSANYDELVKETLELASDHDRDGSYDEVFGVTCAFLWMRGRFKGVKSAETLATIKWIRSRVANYESREQALAFLTIGQLGLLTKEECEKLTGLLTELDPQSLSEIDLIMYLRAALIIEHTETISRLVPALEEKQKNGAWIDLATTATAIANLIETLTLYRKGAPNYRTPKPTLEKMIFLGIIHIQDAFERSITTGEETCYLWDGKASTTAKCLQAWLRFEELVDIPVHELADVLNRYNSASTTQLTGSQALSVLEDLKQMNNELRVKLKNHAEKLQQANEERTLAKIIAQKKSRQFFFVAAPLILVSYLFISLCIGMLLLQGATVLFSAVVKKIFVDGWVFHLSVISLFAAYLVLPWRRWIGGKDDQG